MSSQALCYDNSSTIFTLLYSMEEIFEIYLFNSIFLFTNKNFMQNNLKLSLKNIICAFLYFSIFFIALFTLRFLRLNQTIKIPLDIIYNNIGYIVIIIFIILYNYKKLKICFTYLNKSKQYLWFNTTILLEYLHINLLKFNLYFKFMVFLYKVSFSWISYINNHPNIYLKFPPNIWRRFLNLTYKKPFVFIIPLVIIVLIELFFFKGNIYYTLYILFNFLILRTIIVFMNEFSSYPWEKTCCIADYYHLRWDHPRYPKRFWLWFNTIRSMFNNQPVIDEHLLSYIKNQIEIIQKKSIVEQKRFVKINKKIYYKNTSFCFRYKVAYNKWSQVRWTHTQALPQKVWHPMTSLFARKAIDYGILLNNNWSHFHILEKIKARIHYGEILYKHFDNPYNEKPITISKMLEHNLLTNFAAMANRKVKLSIYDKNLNTDTHNQSADDIQIDPRGATPAIIDTRTHGLDQKATPLASKIPEPSSKIFSAMDPMEYKEVLNTLRQSLLNNVEISPQQVFNIDNALDALAQSCSNLHTHQIIWLECLHLFPNNFIPPLYIPNNFCLDDLIPEILHLYHERTLIFNKISNKLYEHNIPNDYEEAANILDGSFIQQILNEIS